MINGNAVVTDGTESRRVRVFHWWPDRQFAASSPIPESAIQEAPDENRND